MDSGAHIRFVAHIDILGMSAIVERNPDEAWEMLSALAGAKDDATNVSIEFVRSAEIVHVPEVLRTVTFSDTIFLFTKGSSEAELRALIIAVSQIFCTAIYQRVPIRAGVSSGLLYVNLEKSMYAGPALIDAYREGESAQWLGVVFSPSVGDRCRTMGLTSGKSDVVVAWKVPVKSGVVTRTVVNWPALMANQLKVDPPFSTEVFYKIFEPTFGPLADQPPDVVRKYASTVEFFNAQYGAHKA